jgi:hypothetical protein
MGDFMFWVFALCGAPFAAAVFEFAFPRVSGRVTRPGRGVWR